MIRILAEDLEFPEGPVALDDGSVIFVEMPRGNLTRVFADGTKKVVATIPGTPNGAAMRTNGKCVICNNGGSVWLRTERGVMPAGLQSPDYIGGSIQEIDLETGEVVTICDSVDGRRLVGPNDLLVDTTGGIWFTDFGKSRARDTDKGAVCYIPAEGAPREVVFPIDKPNGLALSPDGKVLYVVETNTTRLWAFDLDGPGSISRHGWPSPNGGRLVYGRPGFAGFDGVAVDAAGNILISTVIEGRIIVVTPTGEVINEVEMPDPYPTNIAFGGEDMRTLYVTLSSSGKLGAVAWDAPGLKLVHQK